jgi:DNA-binding MarR family transcriptional regulator
MDESTALIIAALRSLDLSVERLRGAFSRRYAITVNDSLVMSHLSAAGRRLRPGELAERLMITSGSLTPMLDRLVSAGFVERVPNPDDRRSITVVLTDSGERALFTYRDQFRDAIEAAIPAHLRKRFSTCMTQLGTALDELTATFDDERRAAAQANPPRPE